MDINIEKFSGPLGLLLSMIESEEMDITEISLAKIADDYVEYVKAAEDIDSEEMADFLLIAAKLLFIKSKALLPYLYTKEDEEESDDLEKQLKMYKEFIQASQKIKDIIALGKKIFIPPLGKSRRLQNSVPVFSPPAKLTKEIIHDKYAALLKLLEDELKKREEIKLSSTTLEPKISIDDKIASIRKMILEKVKISFTKLLQSAETRTEVIVSFLAVLELAKQKELSFEQDGLFSEIMIKKFNEDEKEENIPLDQE
jgi:segregation and condensation protein A